MALDARSNAIERGLETLAGVRALRAGLVCDDDITVIVDYAHTDDARRICWRWRGALASRRLITVFGAGGDRDRTKRPYGHGGRPLSDVVVITPPTIAERGPGADHRRGEPWRAARDAAARRPVAAIVDRREAILHAVAQGEAGDVVLIAGKGHERYQEIGGVTLPFDDWRSRGRRWKRGVQVAGWVRSFADRGGLPRRSAA